MTVLSRSKNAAARVTRHDSKWTALAAAWPARRPHPNGSSTVRRRFWHVCPPSGGLGAVSRLAVLPPPARWSSAPTRSSSTTSCGCSPRPAPSPSSPPAARRCAAPTGTRRWSWSAPTRWPAGRCGRCRAGRAWSSCPTRELPAGRVGGGRRARAPSAWRCCPTTSRGCWPGRPPPCGRRCERGWLRRRRRQLRGCGRQHRRRPRWRWPPRPAPSSSTPTPWGAGLDLLLGAERVEGLRWPELTGLRGRVGGDALLAALPEVDGVHVLAASRSHPGRRCRTRR